MKIFRHELKYFINFQEYQNLRGKLKLIMKRDEHAGAGGDYHIRSLYFDDYHDTALYEKQSGILHRKKYRIRIYNLSSKVIKLEKKSKVGQFIHKESFLLSKEQALKILRFEYDFLLSLDSKLAIEFYYDLKNKLFRPKVIVDYVREAYIMGPQNIRVTFDKHLKTGLSSVDLFSKDLSLVSAVDEPYTIIEIKYTHMLPDYIKSVLQVESSQRLAISKYVYSRKFNKLRSWEDH
jgi:hypothetical protein